MNPKLTAERLDRGATVYIRQSTPGQVQHHQEGRRRQYALEDHARQLGFQRDHSELRVKKNGAGHHGHSTGMEAIEVVRRMCGRFGDGEIAATLNRLSLRTGAGNGWNAQRVYGLRRHHDLPNNESKAENRMVTLQQAADRLGVSESSIRRMIEQKVLPATQVVHCAPWEISLDALNSPAVQQAIDSGRRRMRPRTPIEERSDSLFSES